MIKYKCSVPLSLDKFFSWFFLFALYFAQRTFLLHFSLLHFFHLLYKNSINAAKDWKMTMLYSERVRLKSQLNSTVAYTKVRDKDRCRASKRERKLERYHCADWNRCRDQKCRFHVVPKWENGAGKRKFASNDFGVGERVAVFTRASLVSETSLRYVYFSWANPSEPYAQSRAAHLKSCQDWIHHSFG